MNCCTCGRFIDAEHEACTKHSRTAVSAMQQQLQKIADQARPVQFDPEYEIAWTDDRAPKPRHRKTRSKWWHVFGGR